ncbi:hypothetical protein FRC98_02755 [Lujinxingia vulgaris]|uniref:Uncharacterized protein n=1 Tax=Lujinxingia vulgaris TaxID=2600176 RepID=A0A5C6XBQ7_9DELT|nr:hypothetical protein [Lujinxingia vulgaris]TXD39336.1 hypothetical protein FRC98_02755 [Lujinxingia vulgaris]
MWFTRVQPPARSGYIFVSVYLAVHALLFLGLTALGVGVASGALDIPLAISQVRFDPIFFTSVMFGLTLAFGIAAAVPLRPWAWQFVLSVLALSLAFLITLPLSIFAISVWLRDDIKRPFGLNVQGPDVALPPEDRRAHQSEPPPAIM